MVCEITSWGFKRLVKTIPKLVLVTLFNYHRVLGHMTITWQSRDSHKNDHIRHKPWWMGYQVPSGQSWSLSPKTKQKKKHLSQSQSNEAGRTYIVIWSWQVEVRVQLQLYLKETIPLVTIRAKQQSNNFYLLLQDSTHSEGSSVQSERD